MAKPDWEAIKSAYQSGESNRSIAARFGVSHAAIGKRARKEGWEKVSSGVSTLKKVSTGSPDGNHVKLSRDKPSRKVSIKEKSGNLSDTKPIRVGRTSPPTNPFPAGNQCALKHGGYGRRLLLSDAIIEDALALTLHDELLWLRAASLTAAENIGRWRAMMDDAENDEARKMLLENIGAAEKSMHRNTVRIESLERTLAGIAIDREMPAKVIADRDYRIAATGRVELEQEKLRRELPPEDDEPIQNVIVVPGCANVDDWERQAVPQQEQLLNDET